MAILPFMIYQLAGFGTLHFVVSKSANWIINLAIVFLIFAGYIANRETAYGIEKTFGRSSGCHHGVNRVLRCAQA